MNEQLFDRIWKVTAYQGSTVPGAFFTKVVQGIEIEKLRVEFTVEKHLDSEPNTATLVITNCSESTRNFLEKKPLIVRIDAGYDGLARHLFTGDLRHGESVKEGTDWRTTLQLADGDRAYKRARVSRSYGTGTSVYTAVSECARAMGLDTPPGLIVSPDLQIQFATGVVLSGPAQQELTKLLAPYGYQWSIQDGKMVVLKDAETRPDVALVVSQDTGLLGSPAFATPTNDGKPPTLMFRTLLYPQLTPGGKVSISSRKINGVFKLVKVTHSGDTHGGDYVSEVEARAA